MRRVSLRDRLSAAWDRFTEYRDGPPAGSVPPRARPAVGVEQHARFLVQKLARYNAAVQSVQAIELARRHGRDVSFDERVRLERRCRAARDLVFSATTDLRLVLGLPEKPSSVEVNGWGETP